MGNALLWLLTVELLGLLAFPVAYRLCGYLQDRGYGLSKALGLLLLTYPLWVLGSMGLPMTRPAALLLLLALAALSCALAWRQRAGMLDFLRREWRLVLALEAVFLLVFTGWALFRSFDPGINHTEQLMDLGLLSAAAKATTFPPRTCGSWATPSTTTTSATSWSARWPRSPVLRRRSRTTSAWPLSPPWPPSASWGWR